MKSKSVDGCTRSSAFHSIAESLIVAAQPHGGVSRPIICVYNLEDGYEKLNSLRDLDQVPRVLELGTCFYIAGEQHGLILQLHRSLLAFIRHPSTTGLQVGYCIIAKMRSAGYSERPCTGTIADSLIIKQDCGMILMSTL